MFILTNGFLIFNLKKIGQIPIIGVGGIENGADVLEKIKCGASLVQLYSSLVYAGPPLINKIKIELAELLRFIYLFTIIINLTKHFIYLSRQIYSTFLITRSFIYYL